MASSPDPRRLVAGLAATALSALAYGFGTGLQPLPWLTWLAPLPLALLAPHVKARWLALAAFVAGALGALNQWHYLHGVIGLPVPAIVTFTALPGVLLALCLLFFRRLLQRGHGIAAALAMPALWVAVEYINTQTSPHGTFGNLAYSQMDLLPVLQLASVTGLWGISFLLLLVPAALAVALTRNAASRTRFVAVAIVVLTLGATWVYGYARLQAPATESIKVGLASMEKPVRPALSAPEGQALLERYLAAVDRLAAAGATVIVTPETAFATGDTTVPAFAEAARRHGLLLAAGIDAKGGTDGERNAQWVFGRVLQSPATYAKHHLIPGFENQYRPGTAYTMLDGAPRIGLAICKDMDFHDIGRAYADRQAQLLLVPAWDFGVDGWLHGRMAIMRGVESGFAVARVARAGRLTLSDDRGRVVAEASSEQHDAELVGELPLHASHTFYAQWGDWFAWADLALLAILLVWACVVPPRSTRT
ncbi:nitrilase-related carbon-nitrogen hydrolase [Dyella sp. 2RAB6]|uniref:nitrilase-related carbon-nitrogen hydrolase n=1 Tax=Dyella sp. 2RAB6 TaxID=3232992 RepID=UPI003F90C5D0